MYPPDQVLLSEANSLKRFQHQMIRMDDTIFAFGGLTEDNFTTDVIKMFNESSQIWEEYDYKLKSKDTGELVAIPYPISSLDCVPEDCNCGLANTIGNSGARIFGGNEADVRLMINVSFSLLHFPL